MARRPSPAAPDMPPFDVVVNAIRHRKPDTGWAIMIGRATKPIEGLEGDLTITGVLAPDIEVGTTVSIGGWQLDHNPRWGRQVKAKAIIAALPANAAGIAKVLAGAKIAKVGEGTANKLLAAFGEGLSDAMESADTLAGVAGVGRERAMKIAEWWRAYGNSSKTLFLLRGHDVGEAASNRVIARYGLNAWAMVNQNPWRLATDIDGIGFLTADKISRALGCDPQSPDRMRAGIIHALKHAADSEGHCCLGPAALMKLAASDKMLNTDPLVVREHLKDLIRSGKLILDGPDRDRIYLPSMRDAEQNVADRLVEIMEKANPIPLDAGTIARITQEIGIKLDPSQADAVHTILGSGVGVLTGGPGTGKTTITRTILAILEEQGLKVALASPTGRAAKRMSQATGREAQTIHRLLEVTRLETGGFGFQKNREHPLKCDALIVDEASMVDVHLARAVLNAVQDGAMVLFVGDKDQLPSVGAGQILSDFIASGYIPVARLTQIHRQKEGSAIITAAHAVNSGQNPVKALADARAADPEHADESFTFVPFEIPKDAGDETKLAAKQAILRAILDVVCDELPSQGYSDIQVLAPMRGGILGVQNLNREIQRRLNAHIPGDPVMTFENMVLGFRDRVIQTANDYEIGVYNGDIGRVTDVRLAEGGMRADSLVVDFGDGRVVEYDRDRAYNLMLAYAITIHKSQGSEFEVVVSPVVNEHFVMLQRNLLYTDITRGKEKVVLLGEMRALQRCLYNVQSTRRNTLLSERLQRGFAALAVKREQEEVDVEEEAMQPALDI